jgi:hypothetical protein
MQRLFPGLGVVCILIMGCGGSGGGRTVQGKVTFDDGRPLTTGTVVFHPDEGKGNKGTSARSAVNDSGVFTLVADGGSGISLGWYKVTVMSTKPNPKDEYAEPIWLIPERFGDIKTSGLAVEVVASPSSTQYDLKVSVK